MKFYTNSELDLHQMVYIVHDVTDSMSVSVQFKSFVYSLYGIFSVSQKTKQKRIENR